MRLKRRCPAELSARSIAHWEVFEFGFEREQPLTVEFVIQMWAQEPALV